jgi:hypothetical protein
MLLVSLSNEVCWHSPCSEGTSIFVERTGVDRAVASGSRLNHELGLGPRKTNVRSRPKKAQAAIDQ